MKTIVCQEPNRFEKVETEVPRRQPGEALVRIRRVGICGTDLHAYRGRQPFFEYPRILGHELSGQIEEVEENEFGLKKGDYVTIIPYLQCGKCIACRNGKTNCCTSLKVLGVHVDGGMREYITVPLDHLIAVNGLSLEQLATVECFSIGAHAVRRSSLSPGETVLVIGAGPIGLGVMKYAKLSGARVIAMDIHQGRLAFCKSWAPADEIVDASAGDPVERLGALTDGDFPTVVFDATGNKSSMETSFQYAAHGGKVVFVGLVKSDVAFHDPDFHKKELTLLSSRNATKEDFERVIESLRKNQVDVSRFVTHRADFDDMIDAFEDWLKPETGVIKAMVKLD